MRTIAIPATARRLNDLFKKARRESLILKSHEGDRFILALLEGWEAFEVGEDFTQNKKLMKFLTERRSKGKTIPFEEVKAELGIR